MPGALLTPGYMIHNPSQSFIDYEEWVASATVPFLEIVVRGKVISACSASRKAARSVAPWL